MLDTVGGYLFFLFPDAQNQAKCWSTQVWMKYLSNQTKQKFLDWQGACLHVKNMNLCQGRNWNSWRHPQKKNNCKLDSFSSQGVMSEKNRYGHAWNFVSSGELHCWLQYIVYDWNDFVADVGGYLGLLLGHSIYGMYDIIRSWISKCLGWSSKKSLKQRKHGKANSQI